MDCLVITFKSAYNKLLKRTQNAWLALFRRLNMKPWNDIKNEFETDGSLRDIYVENIAPSTWDEFLRAIVATDYKLEFTHGGKPLELPGSLSEIKQLQDSDPTTLFIWLDETIQLNCHFFMDTEIEMDVSPHDITSESAYLSLVRFLKWLSRFSNKQVKLTHEGAKEQVILSVGN